MSRLVIYYAVDTVWGGELNLMPENTVNYACVYALINDENALKYAFDVLKIRELIHNNSIKKFNF